MESYEKIAFIIVLAIVGIIINIYAISKKDNEFNGRMISPDQVMKDMKSFFSVSNTVGSGLSDLEAFFKDPETISKLGFATYNTPYILYDGTDESDCDSITYQSYVTFACAGNTTTKTCNASPGGDVALYDPYGLSQVTGTVEFENTEGNNNDIDISYPKTSIPFTVVINPSKKSK